MLAGELPSQLNCYNGGVRIYWPDFSVSQSPYQHPLWLWWKIRQFQERHPAAFAKELLKQISAVSVLSVHPDWLTWSAVESHERAQAIMQAKSAGDNEKLLNIYIQDKEALESTIAKLQSHIDAKSRELQIAYAKINAFESALEKAKTKKSDLDADHSLLPPTSVRESVQRAKSMFKNRLTFCLNSKSEVDKCAFEEPEDLLAALAWLANVYYDSKAGIKCGTPLRQSIKESLSDWFYSGGQSEQTIGEFKEWYHCQLNGRKWELGEHIGTGTSKDARQTIRVGFTWDKDGKQVIIGFIGQHQRSRKT